MRSAESEIAITIFHSAPPHFRIQSINIGYFYVNISSKKPHYHYTVHQNEMGTFRGRNLNSVPKQLSLYYG